MEFDSLRAFVAICDAGSFSAAGQQLSLTQPAVSKRIATLEGQLGARLFDRVGRSVALTPAGKALYPRVLSILADVADTTRAIANLIDEVNGSLALATSHHIGLWRLPPILKLYTRRFPDVSLDLRFTDSELAHQQLLEGSVDLGIVTLAPAPGPNHRLKSIPLWEDTLTFICAADHPLAGSDTSLPGLSRFPAILPDLTTYTGRIITQLFEDHMLTLNVIMSTNYLETIKMLTSVGLGWSVLPASMADSTTHTLNVPGIHISRTLGVVRNEKRTLSNAGVAFLDVLTQYAQDSPR